jgi:uncharacterized glyoxalase superfamily protein PhnB
MSVWPILRHDDTRTARRFLRDVLGFQEAVVAVDHEGDVVHAEMSWPGGGRIVFGSTRHVEGIPGGIGAGSSAVYIATDDVDGVCRCDRESGAEALQGPASTVFGSGVNAYAFTMRDFEGNLWTFGTIVPSMGSRGSA